jgi:hypothetical protein
MEHPAEKPIRLTRHALEQCRERGATEEEVVSAIRFGNREPAKNSRWLYRRNFPFGAIWHGKCYAIKQVAPVVADEPEELVVITVYAFYY